MLINFLFVPVSLFYLIKFYLIKALAQEMKVLVCEAQVPTVAGDS